MTAQRTIVIGDVHGCLEELDELLRTVDLRESDRLVFVGDLMDRGPNPIGCVRRVRELRAECTMGNHEDKHLRWHRHEARRSVDPTYKNPMTNMYPKAREQNAALRYDDIVWMEQLPLSIRLNKRWVVVHAGLETNRSFEDQKNDEHLLRLRDVDKTGAISKRKNPLRRNEGACAWAERWRGPESVIYGHYVHDLWKPRVDLHDDVLCLGIDTGCCFGGRLTAIVLTDGSTACVQVQARQAYTKLLVDDTG